MQFARRPEDFHHSRAYFRILVLLTVLQRDIGIRYNPQLVDRDDFFTDARNLFLHGVLETKQGTCSSLPPLYLAVGRRLGYPLRLVTTAQHFFARWDEPGGERFNIECTSRGLHTYPDEHYLTWPVPVRPEHVAPFGLLKTKTPREELAALLTVRGNCWHANGDYRQAADSYARAWALAPQNQAYPSAYGAALQAWQMKLAGILPRPWPCVQVVPGPRRHPAIPWRAEADLLRLEAIEQFSRDVRAGQLYSELIDWSPYTGVPFRPATSLIVRPSPPLSEA